MNEERLSRFFQLTLPSGAEIEWGVNRFPDGQIQFKFRSDLAETLGCHLRCSLVTSECVDLFLQILQTIHVKECTIMYLYGARSDKYRAGEWVVANVPETLFRFMDTSLKNSVSWPRNATTYKIIAPHCDRLIDERFAPHQVEALWPVHEELIRNQPGYDLIVFPDESARRRYQHSAPLGVPQVTCIKERDQVTGAITRHEIPDVSKAKRILVMDDLCDGGRSFLDIAQLVRDSDPGGDVELLDLYVTHGVFSQGLDVLLNLFNNVWTTNSYLRYDRFSDHDGRFKVLRLW